jgi:hypothetical protein
VTHFRVSLLALATAATVALSGCSFALGDSDDDAADQGVGAAPAEGAGAVPKKQTLTVNKAVWYAGLKITVEQVGYDPDAQPQMTAKLLVDNLGGSDWRPSLPVLFSVGGQQFDGDFVQRTVVGGKQKGRLDMEFRAQDLTAGLETGEFIFGEGGEAQSRLPLGGTGLVSNEPKSVLSSGKTVNRDITVNWKSCEIRADMPPRHEQAQRDTMFLYCVTDTQYTGTSSHFIGDDNFRLKLPDGTVVGAKNGTGVAASGMEVSKDHWVAFQITWPAPGAYTLQVLDVHYNEEPTAERTREQPITL